MYCKLGQACVTNWGSFVLLQIWANVVTNWGSFVITNWDKCYYKLGQLLQIRTTVIKNQATITNWGRMYYKSGQVLQIREIITNCGITTSFQKSVNLKLRHDFIKSSVNVRKTFKRQNDTFRTASLALREVTITFK